MARADDVVEISGGAWPLLARSGVVEDDVDATNSPATLTAGVVSALLTSKTAAATSDTAPPPSDAQTPSFLLVADDAMGGFFALNGGAFGNYDLGKIFYLSPDNLVWEPLEIGYSDFIYWTFTGDIDLFYPQHL